MEFILLFLLFLKLLKCSLQMDCTYDYTPTQQANTCLQLECFDFADFDYPNYCPYQQEIRLLNGGSCYPVHLRFTESAHEGEIPKFRSTYNMYQINCFVSLDLSNDKHSNFPQLESMAELKLLNLSYNSLRTGKLSSYSELPKLRELDYSHNSINELIIIEEEHIFNNLVNLDLSYNKLAEIRDGIFDHFGNMQHLDLSYNRISYVNILSFEGIKKLVYLNLAYNNIGDVNGSLLRFTQLKSLFLNNNNIQNITFKDFEKLNSVEEIDLSCNKIFIIENNVFNAMPLLRSLKLNNNELVNLDKQMFLNASDLYSIDLSYNKIRALPVLIFDGKVISMFDIQKNNIEGPLTNGTFKGLMMVSQLDLSFQNVTSIEDVAFTGIDHLRNLLLNDNQIRTVSSTAFINLHDLIKLDLSNNFIADIDGRFSELGALTLLSLKNNFIQTIKKFDFVKLKELEVLDLSQNNITHIEAQSFESLKNLVDFYVSSCPLSNVLETNTFKGMALLPILDISNTSLSAIQNSSFNQMWSLETLNMSHSAIKEISYNAFFNTSQINILDLSYNLIKYIDVNTSHLANLTVLYLNHNLIADISSKFIAKLTLLNTLNLSYNNIKHLPVDAFTECKELTNLYLGFNKELKLNITSVEILPNLKELFLSGITDTIIFTNAMTNSPITDVQMSHSNITNVTSIGIHNLKNLNTISMDNNDIRTLELGAFSNLDRMKFLDLSFNEIKFIQPGVFKDNNNLNILNISHNQITALNYGVFRGLIYLETLDLSYNDIQDLESERFYDVPHLRNLIIDYNRITKFEYNKDGPNYFSILSLGGNPIPCDMLVKLKRQMGPIITAIKLDESSQENIDGVSCYGRPALRHTTYRNNTSTESDGILSDIRDILLNLSARKATEEVQKSTKSESNVNEQLQKFVKDLNTKITIIDKNANVTNSLLERIIKIIVAYNSRVASTQLQPITKDNATFENILPYLNKIKQDMENSLAIEKETIMADMSDRIAAIDKKLEVESSRRSLTSSDDDKFKSNPFLFLDICVGLMLLLGVCFVAYKTYQCLMLPSRRITYSTQHITHAMENSNL